MSPSVSRRARSWANANEAAPQPDEAFIPKRKSAKKKQPDARREQFHGLLLKLDSRAMRFKKSRHCQSDGWVKWANKLGGMKSKTPNLTPHLTLALAPPIKAATWARSS